MNIKQTIASELNLDISQVSSVLELLADGNTIPFIARYRKEKTNNLDEVQLRDIRDRNDYLSELEARKETILLSIDEQGKLTEELQQKILTSNTKQALEDLYLPYKPKKRTRATIAREMGLEPLAELIRDQKEIELWLAAFIDSLEAPLEEAEIRQRARDIVAEWISEDADIKEKLREMAWGESVIHTQAQKEYKGKSSKFEMYYDFSEATRQIPAHRYLAIRRGEEESVLKIKIEQPEESMMALISSRWIHSGKGNDTDLELAIADSYHRLIAPSIEVDIRLRLKSNSDGESIVVFTQNLKDLLLAPLGGTKVVLGLDPGFRTGTKGAVVDATGKYLDKTVIFPVAPQNQADEAEHRLSLLLKKYAFEFICIGNGTASREVFQFIRNFLKRINRPDIKPLMVNESGASIYSASDVAREEFPDMDVSYRGAVSIARRFQDPLAELVKIDPKSIGVGQYQHDVNQKQLKKSLDEVVETCVNFVGVNLNTASASLLSYVSGMNKTLAKNVITYRDEHGAFTERNDLKRVPRFGPKSFEQSAGFLRIKGGGNPLDGSAVHPENYDVVLKMAEDSQLAVDALIGNETKLGQIDLRRYETETVGIPTLMDIIDELKKPGRDPRTSFIGATLSDDVQTIGDLQVGMTLEGTVTNLTKFGAFVDVGVHHDGLTHLSEMADRFIKDPSEVCGVGDVVKVRVLSVDLDRQRISLTMKTSENLSRKKKKNIKPKSGSPQKPQEIDLNQLANKFKGLK